MWQRVNQDRRGKGLPALAYEPRLADIARYHSDDMVRNAFFAHESPTSGTLDNRLIRAGYLANVARENLAEAPDVDTAEAGLLKSPHHYENLMATDVTHLGIGIVRGGTDPRNLTFTQVFAQPGKHLSPDEALSALRQRLTRERGPGAPGPDPTLQDLAEQAIRDIGDDAVSGVESVGQRAAKALAEKAPREAHRAGAGAYRTYAIEAFKFPNEVLPPTNLPYGIATRDARDEEGRPTTLVLMLYGR